MRFEEALKAMRKGKKVKLRPDEPREGSLSWSTVKSKAVKIHENADLLENEE